MAIKILQGNNLIDAAEYRFLISGLVSTVPDHVPNPNPTWIVDRTWKEILMVSTLPAFQGMTYHIFIVFYPFSPVNRFCSFIY